MNLAIVSDTLASMIRIATPLMLMALGGLLCDRAGVFNIALEGFALIGSFAAIAVVQFAGGSVWAGLLGAMIIGAAYSALYGIFVVKFNANHIIASIAMNTLGTGLTAFLLRAIFGVQGAYSPDQIHKLSMIQIPVIKDNISIIFGGGYYHPDTTLFESPENIMLIKNVRATKVFATAAGVHDKMGITCMNNYELEVKQTIIQSGAEKILLVDSSKFGKIKPCFLTDIDIFDRVITDKKLSKEWVQWIQKKGIQLDLV